MKIALTDQIAEARIYRHALAKALPEKLYPRERLDPAEAVVLTLTVYQEYGTEILSARRKQNAGSE